MKNVISFGAAAAASILFGPLAPAQPTRAFVQYGGGTDRIPETIISNPSFVTASGTGLLAEANLATGEIKALASASGTDSPAAYAYAGLDVRGFQIIGPGVAPLPLTFKVTGAFARTLGAGATTNQTVNVTVYATALGSNALLSTMAQYFYQYFDTFPSLYPPIFTSTPRAQPGTSISIATATPTALDVTVTLSLVPGVDYQLFAEIDLFTYELGPGSVTTDLSHTAKFSLSLPPGYSYRSDTGIFLSVPPAITTQPADVTAPAGSAVTFTVVASGQPAPTYQWRKDGVAIAGATGASFNLPSAQPADAGGYSVVVTNALGAVTSRTAALVVTPPPNPGRLINLSIRAHAGTGAQTLIVGAVIGGAGTGGPKPLLIRAVGPALGPFGVTGFLVDPTLSVLSGAGVVAANDNWGGDAQVIAIGAQVGAFALAPVTSRDAAMHVPALSPGAYTVEVGGVGGTTGVAVAEIYDATPAAAYSLATPRLINLSARTQVGTGANTLFAGLVVGGATPKTLLIRAVGPALTAFGVPGALADPRLDLYAGATLVDQNDNWGGAAPLSAASAAVGAFALAPASLDAALLVTLAPGNYTAQVSGVGAAIGVALIEVYDVP